MCANRKEGAIHLRIPFLRTPAYDRVARTGDAGKSAEHRGQRRDRPLAKLEEEIKYGVVLQKGRFANSPVMALFPRRDFAGFALAACLTLTIASSIAHLDLKDHATRRCRP